MDQTIEGIAALIMGYALQWARAPKSIPSWTSYAGLGLVTVGVWFFSHKDAVALLQSDWRSAVAGMVMLAMAARGIASVSSGAKVAPKTDSL